MRRYSPCVIVPLAALIYLTGCSAPKETAVITARPEPIASTEAPPRSATSARTIALTPFPEGYEDAQAGRFDGGKMWTFDHPPLDYFEEAYGFRPDSLWFEKARMGALRFSTYCSASFVSPNGLVMTNHHCGRESISTVSKAGEDLLDNGFYAQTLDAERKVEDLYVDQLIKIEDVTEEVYAAIAEVKGDDEQARARQQRAEALEKRRTNQAKAQDSTLYVQVIALYNGGQYSAYTFRRYDDVRLVMAPELQIGYYGGDPDNFTYPRYNFDMSFFRVYNSEGSPLQPAHYFSWSAAGAREGEAVFVVGNPGSTSRQNTVAQLEFERDYELPHALTVLRHRADILEDYIYAHPDEAEDFEIRNDYFSIRNSIKASEGQLQGLRDPELIARRTASERRLQEALEQVDSLREAYGDVYQDIRATQSSKEATAEQANAFTYFLSPSLSSHVLIRSIYGYFYALMKQRGAPPDQLKEIRDEVLEVKDWPPEVEKAFIAARMHDLRNYLGANDPTVQRILGTLTPEALADSLVDHTALIDSAGFVELLDKGYLNSKDVTVPVVQALAPLYFTLSQQLSGFESREENLNARLARAQFTVFGREAPPDASFSLRIADGVVKGYAYNGTRAPAFTTLYGLYDHFYSYKRQRVEWDLPERWQHPPATFDLTTPVNLASTNDISGGNSGSPLLNKDLQVVGLIFDSNIEALPNEYVYSDTAGRSVSVDARGILEVLDEIYDADRIVLELRSGQLTNSEEDADAALSLENR